MNTKLNTILKIIVAVATALLGALGVTQAMN
ncbi:MAG: smalltalk protein [Prevotella sp.]|nr:smalltalk protein [Prevotella sp.]MDE6353469.1 smalltalk protein [Prevotella sp.]